VFSEWLKEIFSQNDVGSVADFIKKTTSAPPLTSREGKFNTALLKPSVQFISADVVTQNRIVFPDMARLFWSGSKLELIDPSLFVRAAASIPFFFESVIVDKLSAEDPEIKNAWLELFGEYRPPKSACLVDGNIVPVFPITFFQTPGTPDAPMPTFGVSTMSSYETLDAENVHKLPWSKYLSRLLDTSKYNRTSNEVSHDNAMQKGMCRIELSVTSWLDFGLDDARKLWLFTRGAEAATNFLLKFNWEEYKRSLNLSTALRV
jgi:NTE family protein